MKPSEALTDTEIVARVLQGEKSLYELIVRRFNPYLYKVGRSYNYNHEDTQDLMQDSFVDAFRNLAQFQNRSSFKTWIVRIMLNNCFRKKEKAAFKNEVAMAFEEDATPLFTHSDADTMKEVYRSDMKRVMEEALTRLPQDYRMVFSLRAINELNVAETADLLGISETNVKVRLNRAKAMLRAELEKSYSPGELFDFNLVYCDAMVENVMAKINNL